MRRRGLAFRLLVAHVLVVAVSLLVAAAVACLAGPPLFHEHLLMTGREITDPERFHIQQAYQDAGLITLAVALATALVCAVAASFWIARRLRTRLGYLTEAAEGVAVGSYNVRVPTTGAGTEIAVLAQAFNSMADRLAHTEETRRRMLSDLAHEMSTPVSVLGVYVEGLQDGVAEWDDTTSAVLVEQLARLTRLVEDIGDVSRAEEGRIQLETTDVPVSELIQAAKEAAGESFTAKGVRLQADTQASSTASVTVDSQRIGQVLGNLLSNALRHTPVGGGVTIGARMHAGNAISIDVCDTGEGLTGEQLDHVFERFYRSDTARDRDHGGSGVGLTISRAFAEAHGGTLTASSAGLGHGSVFTITLPCRMTTDQQR